MQENLLKEVLQKIARNNKQIERYERKNGKRGTYSACREKKREGSLVVGDLKNNCRDF